MGDSSFYNLSLPDQLRYMRSVHAKKCGNIDYGPCAYCTTMRKSADEIERLQSRLDDAAKTLQIASYDMTRRRYMLDEKAFSRIIEALNGDKSNDRQ